MHFDLASLGDSALRLILALASGIGFLGAGIILREGRQPARAHTATMLWCSAMVATRSGADRPDDPGGLRVSCASGCAHGWRPIRPAP
jgi:putative Mg2+ transporter-C (MgtC) family protein